MQNASVQGLVVGQRRFFASGKTKDVTYRIQVLERLHRVISDNEGLILKALAADMKKPKLEAYASEIAITLNEIKYIIRKLLSWTKPKRVMTARPLLPSLCSIIKEPYGVVLILAPWNYPFQLAMAPLVGAIAAGNCAVVKPSELAPATSDAIEKIFNLNFDQNTIAVVTGGPDTARSLLEEQFDYIFYTGSSRVGKIIMEAAARHLTPITLELGGKSPCIVDADVNLTYAARRIVWAKFFNAGQTCIAPDYLLVDNSIKDVFLSRLKEQILHFFGHEPFLSPDYARIINSNHFKRLNAYLSQGEIVIGGQVMPDDRFIAPTVMDKVPLESPIMTEEIFGPILPVISYTNLSEAIDFVNARPKPLSLYVFTRDKVKQDRVLSGTSSGAVCINDALVHFASHYLPFGGVGDSGMGKYHGRSSFETFSHVKSLVKNTMRFDIPLRYAPYRFKFWFVKKFF
ncbi:MAG TPA: aldehyde dehydrogenase [Desulfomonilia bacterium]|nr:aldehyde dehydrogenase [Desulfomonilia bacterium]